MSRMTYEELLQVLENEKTVNLSVFWATVEGMVSTSDTYDEYETEYSDSIQAKLRNLVKRFVQKDLKVFGTADHYHNIAVTYAQKEMNDCACDILQVGIDDIPYAVDLIADYIHYGMLGGQRDKCEEMFLRLKSITRRRWNWRAYSFSIDYLIDKCKYINNESEQEEIKRETLELAKQFIATEKTNREYLDQAYFDKAAVYAEFGDKKNEYKALEEGFNEMTSSSKCALRLADIAFSKGDYEDAIKKLKHCCNRIKPQPDIKGNYAYLLLALSKTTKLFEEENISQDKEEQVKSIYRDFYSALSSGLSGVYRETANTAIKIISSQTEIEYPYDDSAKEENYDF